VTPDGLCQLGHSKDGRPDLPQVKINMSTLDPLGLPLTITVVSGEKADDPLYLPEIRKVQATLEKSGVTYVGDSKMAALETRATIAGSNDFYLCPLPNVQMPKSELEKILAPVWDKTQALTPINRPSDDPNATPDTVAEGFSFEVVKTTIVDGQTLSWSERRFVVLSFKFADSQADALRKRLDKAIEEIEKLNERRQGKKCFTAETELRNFVDAIIKKYRIEGLLVLTYEIQQQEHTKRRYLNRPARSEVTTFVSVSVQVDEDAKAHAIRQMGWRVYVTNQADLTLEQTVLAYREQYLIERGFRRLKDKPLSLTPMYLDSDQRIKGLIRLLTIALRVLILLEFQVRQSLRQTGEKLAGLYPGNPRRSTANPTAEMMLRVFRGITTTYLWGEGTEGSYVTPLSATQQRILALLDIPPLIYTCFEWHSSEPALKMSEP
jgi:Transposase